MSRFENEASDASTDVQEEVSGRVRSCVRLPIRLALWGLGFIVVLWLMLLWGVSTGVHNDFTQNVWLPSRLIMNGVNPYNPPGAQVDAALGDYASAFTTIGFNSGKAYHAIYPIWVYVIFTPFAALPLTVSLAIWRAANLLLLLWGITRLLCVSNPSFRMGSVASIGALVVTAAVSFVYRETIVTLFSGQFSIIEFALLAGIWGYLVSSRNEQGNRRLIGDILMGLALAVLATKPQALGLPVLLLGLWALSRRRWAIPVSALASLGLLMALPLVFFPTSIGDWLRIVVSGQAASQVTVSASVWGLSYRWLNDFIPWVPAAIALSLIGLASLVPSWWHDLTDRFYPVPLALPLTITVNSIISPYLLGYEEMLLLVPAMIFLAAAGLPTEQRDPRSRRWRLILYGWIALLPFLIVVIQTFEDLELYLIIQSLAMLAMCWAANCGLSISADAPASRFVLRTLRSEPNPQHTGAWALPDSGNPHPEGGTVGNNA